jgi:transposase
MASRGAPRHELRDDEVLPNAAGIDIGASSHWVAVPRHLADDAVRELGAMTDDLNPPVPI